jgi:hypothetical protein
MRRLTLDAMEERERKRTDRRRRSGRVEGRRKGVEDESGVHVEFGYVVVDLVTLLLQPETQTSELENSQI